MTTMTLAPEPVQLAAATTMKAIVRSEYGSADVLRLAELPRPVPGEGQVLVRVRAASINAADNYLMRGRPQIMRLMFGLLRPKITRLGQDLAGEVVSVGRGVTRFAPGDAVFGAIPDLFGQDIDRAFAEYARVPESLLVSKPENVSFEEAAAVPLAALTALQGLRDAGRIQGGHHVMVNGASGGVGTYAVQLAKAFGAEVTAVCSTQNLEQARRLGADHVIDYTREDFLAGAPRFDLLLDVAATRSPRECRRVMKPDAVYVWAGTPHSEGVLGPLIPMLRMRLAALFAGKRRVTGVEEKPNQADLVVLQQLLAAGKLKSPIEKTYRLSEVPDAMRRFGEGHVRGKLVITC